MRTFHRSITQALVLALAGMLGAGAFGQAVDWSDRYTSLSGDINADRDRDLSDAIALLSWLYSGGPAPAGLACELQAAEFQSGDVNADGSADVSDAVYMLSWLFAGGPEPVATCGESILGEGGNQGHHLEIISPEGKYQGRTYGEWTALWWRWAINLPVDGHPFFDASACDKGQHGPVWFLTGNFNDTTPRDCTIPAGKAILVAIVNSECSNVEPPPFFGSNEAEMRQCAKDFTDGASGVSASLDGRSVRHIGRFRVQSPLFGVNYPANNILGVAGPGSALSVADGYFLLIAPPREGDYTIEFAGMFPGLPLDMTYHIHVVDLSDPRVEPIDEKVGGKTYGDWGAEWWKLVVGIPFDQSPVPSDSSGCLSDQHGPVYFLFGNFGGTSERECTVPAGKPIYFPMLNAFNDFPCPDPAFAPAPGQSLEDFLAAGIDPTFSNLVTGLIAELDGVAIPNLKSYRATSRLTKFTADLSNQVIDPCVTGSPQHGVSDGYMVILKPLSPGQHTLRFGGSMDFFGTPFSLDVTYHLTVKRGR